MVRHLKDNGRCALAPVGTWSNLFAEGARVAIYTDDMNIKGQSYQAMPTVKKSISNLSTGNKLNCESMNAAIVFRNWKSWVFNQVISSPLIQVSKF